MASTLIPGLGPRDEMPRPNPAADPIAAGLSAQEGWVLSRVDGHTTFGELFLITGLGESQTVEILKTLIARGLVLTKNGGRIPSPAAQKPTVPIPRPREMPTSKPPTSVAKPPLGEADVVRVRAEVQAADEAAQAAMRGRERAVAEEMAAQRTVDEQKEQIVLAEIENKTIESRREAARLAEDHARASVQALRDSLVRAEMELTRLTKEREKITRETEGQVQRASAARAQAGQAIAFAELAGKARERALADEQAALGRAAEKAATARSVEEGAQKASEEARRRADEDTRHALDSLLKGYANEEVARPRSKTPARTQAADVEAAADAAILHISGDSDLPDEARKRIMRKHVKLATQDLFELLELALDCDKKDIKRAYFKLSKDFHPDRFFGKRLGPYKAMIAEVFRAVSQAAEYLGDDDRRAEYQSMIRTQHEMRELEESLARATAAAIEEDRQSAEQETAPPPADDAASFASSPSEARAAGAGKWARKGTGEYPVSPPPNRTPVAGSRLVKQMLARNLEDERLGKAQKAFEDAGRQAKNGQWVSAFHNYKLAATFAPDNAEYAARLAEAEEKAGEIQAAAHAKRAEFEERAGRFDAAAQCWEQAVGARPTVDACAKAVEMFLQIRELNKALDYGIKGVELDSANASAHLALARVYRERKQLVDAKRSAERAISLDPKHQAARELLREIAKSA